MCIQKRIKGLLALMTCVMILAGMPLPVKAAADYDVKDLTVSQNLSAGDRVHGDHGNGESLGISGGLRVVLNGTVLVSQNMAFSYGGNDYYSDCILPCDCQITDIKKQQNNSDFFWTVTVSSGSAGQTENKPAAASHTHNYEWETERDATAAEDGEMVLKCTVCGDVKQRVPISKYSGAMREAYDRLNAARAGQKIIIDTKDTCSFNRSIMEKLAEDTQDNITVVIRYTYRNVGYTMTVPAGSDPDTIRGLVDENGYAGFRQIDKVFQGAAK